MSSDNGLTTFFSSPTGRTAAIAGGALVVLGAGSLLYSRNSNSNSNLSDSTRAKRAVAKHSKPTKSGASSAASASDDEYIPAPRTRPPQGANTLNPVAVLWDVDNCPPPTGSSGRAIVQAIRRAVQAVGPDSVLGAGNAGEELLPSGPIVMFKAYLELSDASAAPSPQQVLLRSELQGCGVSLIDTPKSGRKDVADKMLITDMLAFAIDQPSPARVVAITGDRDYAYSLGCLRNRNYSVVLVVPPVGAPPILEASANVVVRWRQDVLGMTHDANGRPYAAATPKRNNGAGSSVAAFGTSPSKALHPPTTPMHTRQADFVRGPGGQPVPAVFSPLITVLEQVSGGAPRSERLAAMDEKLYERAGASRWADYAAVAEAAGFITLGTGQPGKDWVALRTPTTMKKKLEKKEYDAMTSSPFSVAPASAKKQPPSTPTPTPTPNKARADEFARGSSPTKRFAQLTPEPAHSSPLTKSDSSSGNPGGTSIPLRELEKTLPHAPSKELIPICFFALANFLLNERTDGNDYVADTKIQRWLSTSKHKMAVYIQSTNSWVDYLMLAREYKIVRLKTVPGEESLRVSIHPRLTESSARGQRPKSPENPPRSDGAQEGEYEQDHSQRTQSTSRATSGVSERAKFKPLVDILVRLRRGHGEAQPSRSLVNEELEEVISHSAPSSQEWYSEHGSASGFDEYVQHATNAGFALLCTDETSGADCLRLAPKYEKMFFPDQA
ncbi:LIMKAIN B (LKAP) [Ceraceosorus bombacis]|uniref:LIMKAIN B (LKAP) n=1 Tax=Ceraceosorus bombacis TaxID=401625 RepID=A0A0P1BMB2_9BASI|nr:LIMKAIN B (LKAP) [Ceraceosorus bombacis]